MKYKFSAILLLIFSYIFNSEITYEYFNSDQFLSINFILIFLSLILMLFLFRKGDKYKYLFILFLIISIIFMLARVRFLIGSLHVLD